MGENLTVLHASNKGADQPVHLHSLISTVVISLMGRKESNQTNKHSLSGKNSSQPCSMQNFNILAKKKIVLVLNNFLI